jgi:hypothetical protein
MAGKPERFTTLAFTRPGVKKAYDDLADEFASTRFCGRELRQG